MVSEGVVARLDGRRDLLDGLLIVAHPQLQVLNHAAAVRPRYRHPQQIPVRNTNTIATRRRLCLTWTCGNIHCIERLSAPGCFASCTYPETLHDDGADGDCLLPMVVRQ